MAPKDVPTTPTATATGSTARSALVSVVAENIRRLRVRQSISLSELAARAGLGKSTLSPLESGKGNPSIETLWTVAAALGVPVGQLIEPAKPTVRVLRAGEGVQVDAAHSDFHAFLLTSSNRRCAFELYVGPGDLVTFAGDVRHHYETLEPGTRSMLLMEYD